MASRSGLIVICGGGNMNRVEHGTDLARTFTDYPVIVSGEVAVEDVLRTISVDLALYPRVTFDFRAYDTLTHFTVLVDYVLLHRVTHLIIVTEDWHAQRALLCASIVFAGMGVEIDMVAVNTGVTHVPESEVLYARIRDGLRAYLARYLGWLIWSRDRKTMLKLYRRQIDAEYMAKKYQSYGYTVIPAALP